jgi:hypothetical protein
MMHGVGPFSAHLSPEAMHAGSQLALVEGLKAGTTTFADFGWSMDDVCALVDGRRAKRDAQSETLSSCSGAIYLYQTFEQLVIFRCVLLARGGPRRSTIVAQ